MLLEPLPSVKNRVLKLQLPPVRQAVLRRLAWLVSGKVVDWSGRHRLPYDCVVNATPIGMHPKVNETPFEAKHLRPYMVVFDTVTIRRTRC